MLVTVYHNINILLRHYILKIGHIRKIYIDKIGHVFYNQNMMEYKLSQFETLDFELHMDEGTMPREFPMHSHDFMEMTIITEGEASHITEYSVEHVCAGCVNVILPGHMHTHRDINNLRFYNFKFNLKRIVAVLPELAVLDGFRLFFMAEYANVKAPFSTIYLDEEKFAVVKNICALMWAEYCSKRPGYVIASKCYFLSLLVNIINAVEAEHGLNNDKYRRIAIVTEYIESHFGERIKIADLEKYLEEKMEF